MEILGFKNAASKNQDNSIIDLEIETDLYGWIPTTIKINDGDTAPHVLTIKQWIYDNPDLIAPYVAQTTEELNAIKMAQFEAAIQDYLDQGAKSFGYDDINSIAKYLVIDNPFYHEASILSLWAADVWVYSFSQIQVYKGELDAFLLTLPKLEV